MTDINDILRQPYRRVIVPDETGLFAAEILEFPGCVADGETPEEAYQNLEEVAVAWLESMVAHGQPIPSPYEANEASGTLSLRLPKTLHGRAIRCAERERVSLNTFLVTAVASAVGSEQLNAQLNVAVDRAVARLERAATNQNWFIGVGDTLTYSGSSDALEDVIMPVGSSPWEKRPHVATFDTTTLDFIPGMVPLKGGR